VILVFPVTVGGRRLQNYEVNLGGSAATGGGMVVVPLNAVAFRGMVTRESKKNVSLHL